MAKTLGTLTVLIGASTALFQRELERAGDATEKWAKRTRTGVQGTIARIDDDLSRFSREIDKAFSDPIGTIGEFVDSIKLVGPALKTGAVAAGAFAASFTLAAGAGIAAGQAFNTLTEDIQITADTADRLGVSFEFLQGIEGVLGAFNIEADEVIDNLFEMNLKLGETLATLNAGEQATDDFAVQVRAMGLSFEELFALDPEERLLAFVDAMSALPSETEKVAAAVAVFGESGRDLLSVLDDGSASLEEMIEQASQLGSQLSGQEIQRINEARSSLYELGLVVEGLKEQFLASFAPIFTTLTDFLLVGRSTGEGVTNFMEAMADAVARVIGFIDQVVVAGFKAWYAFRGTVQLVAAGVVSLAAGMQSGVEAAINGISSVLASAATGISRFMANVVNGALDSLNRVITAVNTIPGVNVPTIDARVAHHDFGGGLNLGGSAGTRDLARSIASDAIRQIQAVDLFEAEFYENFQANRNVLPVPALPPGGIGELPPPPGSGGGGGGRSGGGRGSVEQKAKKDAAAIRDLEKAIEQARQSLEKLNTTFSDEIQSTLESNEAEEYRLELMQQGAMRIDEQVNRFEALRDIRAQFIQSEQELEGLLDQGLITQQQYSDALANVTSEYERLEEAFAESDAIAQAQDQTRAIVELTDQLNESLRDTLGINEELTEVERVRAEIRALDVELTEKQIVSLEKLASVVDLTAERTRRLQEQYDLLDETSRVLVDSGSTLFQELIRGTGSLSDKLGNFFNSLFDNLLQLSINTIFQSLLGGGGSGGFLGGLLGFQSGGVVPETGPYILHSGERVFNRAEVARMRHQEGGNVVVNNYSGARVSTQTNGNGDREIIIREAVAQARTAVANDFTRSVSSGYGAYSEGIQGSYKLNRKI